MNEAYFLNYSNAYRYGFNGQEKEPELGNGFTSAEFWMYDGRLGRRWNIDPVVKPWESGYACFGDAPTILFDPDGREATSEHYDHNGKKVATIIDGDNGKYKHGANADGGAVTRYQLEKRALTKGTSSGGEKFGIYYLHVSPVEMNKSQSSKTQNQSTNNTAKSSENKIEEKESGWIEKAWKFEPEVGVWTTGMSPLTGADAMGGIPKGWSEGDHCGWAFNSGIQTGGFSKLSDPAKFGLGWQILNNLFSATNAIDDELSKNSVYPSIVKADAVKVKTQYIQYQKTIYSSTAQWQGYNTTKSGFADSIIVRPYDTLDTQLDTIDVLKRF